MHFLSCHFAVGLCFVLIDVCNKILIMDSIFYAPTVSFMGFMLALLYKFAIIYFVYFLLCKLIDRWKEY